MTTIDKQIDITKELTLKFIHSYFNQNMNCKMRHKRWMNKIVELLKKNDDKMDWSSLSSNPYTIFILEENQDKINWPRLSINPNATSILQKNQDKIGWNWLSSNLNAISILQKNQDKIDWYQL